MGLGFIMRSFVPVVAALVFAPAVAHCANFYEGKTVRIIVSTGPGGGYDAYGRLLSRHMPRYVSGNPTMIVQNMPGASGMSAANYLYNVAAPDGLTIGTFQRQIAFAPLLANTAARYDPLKFNWIGTSNSFKNDASFLMVRKVLGIKTVEDIRNLKQPLQLGVGGRTSVGYEGARVISSVLDLNIRIIIGYRSSARTQLAVESGELDAMILGISSLSAQKPEWLKPNDDVVQLLQFGYGGEGRHPRFPKVPRLDELASTDTDKGLFRLFQVPFKIAFPFIAPPNVDAERVRILRSAFDRTHKDPEFIKDAKKLHLEISPLSGQEVTEIIAAAYRLPPSLVAKYVAIQKGGN
jgi:tripartite-type tricarboxylate transporter receptor subunit TctC